MTVCATCGYELIDVWRCGVFVHLHSSMMVATAKAVGCSCCACIIDVPKHLIRASK